MPQRARGITVDLSVPPPDSEANVLVKDVIGNRLDGSLTTTIAGRIEDEWEGRHSVQQVYPPLAQGVLVTAAVAAWTLGSYSTIIPINTIVTDFHIHHVCICSAGAVGDYELRLYTGAGVRIGGLTFTVSAKKDDPEGLDLLLPHSLANSRIRAKLASSNAVADTVRIKFWYHLHES